MNRFMDALWDLKLRVDAHDEHDEKANRAFETLKSVSRVIGYKDFETIIKVYQALGYEII